MWFMRRYEGSYKVGAILQAYAQLCAVICVWIDGLPCNQKVTSELIYIRDRFLIAVLKGILENGFFYAFFFDLQPQTCQAANN
ncbi:hypothetical protein KSZ_15600 [Dictyobacter formicarum]|uniref:Uncharacterized protein n=1 Tax=Dictyobacter formicarum TaxID=2778368 RepID=A0ABQ3VCN8_9CHLR|nr:hypothetical protein KSZ_15600 [Dictyobacter formicarum]